MTTTISQTAKSLRAETRKLKRTITPWIALGGGASGVLFAFIIFYFKVDIEVDPDINPWGHYFNLSFAVASMLLLIPTVVLLAASLAFVEHRAGAWKYLYSLPLSKGAMYSAKLLLFIAFVAIVYLSFLLTALATGYLLGLLRPEFGFQFAWPGIGEWLRILLRSFIAMLGLGALQFVISIWWSNYLLAVGLGFLGTVMAPVLIGQTELAYWIPYCYPVFIAQSLDFTDAFVFEEQMRGWLTTAEWYSLGYFVILVGIGYLRESRRDVK